MKRIGIISDIHGDANVVDMITKDYKMDYLFLVGDLGEKINPPWNDFNTLKKISEQFKGEKIIFLYGNNDYNIKKYILEAKSLPKVSIVNDCNLQIEGVDIKIITTHPNIKDLRKNPGPNETFIPNWEEILDDVIHDGDGKSSIMMCHYGPECDTSFTKYKGKTLGIPQFNEVLKKHHIDYFFHGHVHDPKSEMTKIKNTKIYNVARNLILLELNNGAMKMVDKNDKMSEMPGTD